MMKIAILDDYQDCVRRLNCFQSIQGHDVKIFTNPAKGVGQLQVRLAPFDALVLNRERTRLPKALLARLPNLKLIAQTGKVTGHIDVDAATAAHIVIAEGVGDPTAPAELAWALIMASSRHLVPYVGYLREGLWQTASANPAYNTLGRVLKGRTLGLWSYGKIGRLVARYAQAFGMRVMVWGSEASRAAAMADGIDAAASRDALFAQSDVLSLHLRLSESTRGIVTAGDLALMKPDALLVNTSRAELIEPGALINALQQGRPGYAALDVFDNEPLPVDSPLLRMHNVLATPHLGYVERDSYELYYGAAFQNVVDFANGTPKNVLNPAALEGGLRP